MKLLVMAELQFVRSSLAISMPQQITMPLVPRRVVDFRDDVLDALTAIVEDIEQIQRAHVVPKAS